MSLLNVTTPVDSKSNFAKYYVRMCRCNECLCICLFKCSFVFVFLMLSIIYHFNECSLIKCAFNTMSLFSNKRTHYFIEYVFPGYVVRSFYCTRCSLYMWYCVHCSSCLMYTYIIQTVTWKRQPAQSLVPEILCYYFKVSVCCSCVYMYRSTCHCCNLRTVGWSLITVNLQCSCY